MPARAFAIPLAAAVIGGGVTAGILVGTGSVGQRKTTTIIQQAPLTSASPASESHAGGLTARDIYRRAAPGVVYIRARSVQQTQSPFDVFPRTQENLATGSGFVLDDKGDILTNAHVVASSLDVRVSFSDHRTVSARVIGKDADTDLAVLAVNPKEVKLHPLVLGNSGTVRVGDPTVAIGNPFGLERTLTTGVISAKARQIDSLQAGFKIGNVLQTDAAINPGNSGGPLLDAQGRVLGVNSQIETSGGGGSVGIGFAVPVDTLKEVIPRLRREGAIERAYLGVDTLTVDPSLESLHLPVSDGALVQTVTPGSPADRAGLRPSHGSAVVGGERIAVGGDIIRAIDGKRVRTNDDLAQQIGAKRPGDRVKITYVRGGDEHSAQVTLAKRPGAGG